ncbi:hypothetical protein RM543_18720 [Roseicyclus sp. F158]|uniref:Uncharacterized protein n=1 Tax=Tropicimonas omnivorans TaxID=3075590 RepID=A0ABU3DLU6_9RHOB|nr:hypothetical protein [Roseicyclus sp. F158]MDT0684699.1 hypothetical protein [Roseicyclus sp. F158]
MIIRKEFCRFFTPMFFVAAMCFVLVSEGIAMGDPLINLRRFFTDLFRVQIDGPEVIRRGSDPQLANTPPSDPEFKRALHLSPSAITDNESLTCGDIVFLGYYDWLEKFNEAQEARLQAQDNRTTPEMRWPNFWDWNSPVFARTTTRRTFLGNLKSVPVSVAVLGNNWDISNFINPEINKLTDSALQRVFSVKGRGYDSIYEFHIDSKDVVLSEALDCDGFTIFNIEVQ